MKIIKIKCCAVCPFIRDFDNPEDRYCCIRKIITGSMESTYSMKNPYRIPKWCPLDDYKESENEG